MASPTWKNTSTPLSQIPSRASFKGSAIVDVNPSSLGLDPTVFTNRTPVTPSWWQHISPLQWIHWMNVPTTGLRTAVIAARFHQRTVQRNTPSADRQTLYTGLAIHLLTSSIWCQ